MGYRMGWLSSKDRVVMQVCDESVLESRGDG